MHLDWVKQDGPPVRPRGRAGFGSQLVDIVVGQSERDDTGIAFDRTGVVCRVDFPRRTDGPQGTDSAEPTWSSAHVLFPKCT